MKIKTSDFNIELLNEVASILNRRHSCELKVEKNNIVAVELKRRAKIKSPVNEVIISDTANDNEQGSSKNTK